MKLILLLLWLVCIFGFDIWNWYIIVKKKLAVKHPLQVVYRLIIGGVLAYFSYSYSNSSFEFYWFLIYQLLTFTLLFNMILNLERHLPIFYINPKGNKTDKLLDWIFQRTVPEFFYWIILVAAFLAAYAYFIGKDYFYYLLGI